MMLQNIFFVKKIFVSAIEFIWFQETQVWNESTANSFKPTRIHLVGHAFNKKKSAVTVLDLSGVASIFAVTISIFKNKKNTLDLFKN